MVGLLNARIFHERLRPKRNRFGYNALYCLLPVRELAERKRLGLFSLNGANLFSLRAADYGREGTLPGDYVAQLLKDWHLDEADGEIRLMTLPRVLGYGFNPVSFWFCFDKTEGLRAVVAEVNNTFGERHSYLCCHDDHRVIDAEDTLTARKVFHVSPFIKVEGDYTFRFQVYGGAVAVGIDLADAEGVLLRTSVAGRLQPMSAGTLFSLLAKNPLYPFKVIGLIHYQAIKLFLKGIRHFRKPAPPETSVSHG
jgi:hypothetical protein